MPPTVSRCESCAEYVFYNPTPSARVVVVDESGPEPAILLVTRPDGVWITPGGKLEVGNDPDEHAARELAEETNLTVDPDDLVLFHSSTVQPGPGEHVTSLVHAVRRERISGTLRAGSDAGDARFWTADEVAAADDRFHELHAGPAEEQTFEYWLREARAALP